MAHAETLLINKILLRHASRPDVRLWRNETGLFWHKDGIGRIQCGLCVGSADLIGIARNSAGYGVFVALEVKTAGTTTTKKQLKFIKRIVMLGGIAGVVEDMDGVDFLLGTP